jgi:hypothetical protein
MGRNISGIDHVGASIGRPRGDMTDERNDLQSRRGDATGRRDGAATGYERTDRQENQDSHDITCETT